MVNSENNLIFGEKCICELCECGHHHCPHLSESYEPFGHEELDATEFGISEYARTFVEKHVVPQEPFYTSASFYGAGEHLIPGPGTRPAFPQSTHRADFVPWIGVQPAVSTRVRETDYLKPTIPFDISSTYVKDFTEKQFEHDKLAKIGLSDAHYQSKAPFTAVSTNRRDFDRKQIEMGTGKAVEFVDGEIAAQKMQKVPFEIETTYKRDFREFPNDTPPSKGIKIETVAKRILTPFMAETDYRANFNRKIVEPTESFKPRWDDEEFGAFWRRQRVSAPFCAQSTYNADFRSFGDIWICPAEMVLTRRDKRFIFTHQDRRGHLFYRKRRLQANGVANVSIPKVKT